MGRQELDTNINTSLTNDRVIQVIRPESKSPRRSDDFYKDPATKNIINQTSCVLVSMCHVRCDREAIQI